jgi:hypothetical protein
MNGSKDSMNKTAEMADEKGIILNNLSEHLSILELFDILKLFFGVDKIRDMFESNIATVNEHLLDIRTEQTELEFFLKSVPDINPELEKRIKRTIVSNVNTCHILYEYFVKFNEVSRYVGLHKEHIVATNICISENLKYLVMKCFDILSETGKTVNFDIDPNVYYLTNKQRFITCIMAIIQSVLTQYPSVNELDISLKKSDIKTILCVAPVHTKEVKIEQNHYFDFSQIIIEFFCKTYKCDFYTKMLPDSNARSSCIIFPAITVPPEFLQLEFHSPNSLLNELIDDDEFSVYHTMLYRFTGNINSEK